MDFIKRLIPGHITVRSLYWVQRQKEMESELRTIFHCIDNDKFAQCQWLIEKFHEKWDGMRKPLWLSLEIESQIYRAEAMLNILTAPIE